MKVLFKLFTLTLLFPAYSFNCQEFTEHKAEAKHETSDFQTLVRNVINNYQDVYATDALPLSRFYKRLKDMCAEFNKVPAQEYRTSIIRTIDILIEVTEHFNEFDATIDLGASIEHAFDEAILPSSPIRSYQQKLLTSLVAIYKRNELPLAQAFLFYFRSTISQPIEQRLDLDNAKNIIMRSPIFVHFIDHSWIDLLHYVFSKENGNTYWSSSNYRSLALQIIKHEMTNDDQDSLQKTRVFLDYVLQNMPYEKFTSLNEKIIVHSPFVRATPEVIELFDLLEAIVANKRGLDEECQHFYRYVFLNLNHITKPEIKQGEIQGYHKLNERAIRGDEVMFTIPIDNESYTVTVISQRDSLLTEKSNPAVTVGTIKIVKCIDSDGHPADHLIKTKQKKTTSFPAKFTDDILLEHLTNAYLNPIGVKSNDIQRVHLSYLATKEFDDIFSIMYIDTHNENRLIRNRVSSSFPLILYHLDKDHQNTVLVGSKKQFTLIPPSDVQKRIPQEQKTVINHLATTLMQNERIYSILLELLKYHKNGPEYNQQRDLLIQALPPALHKLQEEYFYPNPTPAAEFAGIANISYRAMYKGSPSERFSAQERKNHPWIDECASSISCGIPTEDLIATLISLAKREKNQRSV